MRSEHTVLLYHTEVRWLFRDRVLDRAVNLSKEIDVLLRKAGKMAKEKFEDQNFLLMPCYLAGIF